MILPVNQEFEENERIIKPLNEVGGQIKEAEMSLCCEKAVYILQLVLSEAELGQWDEGGERRLFDYPQPVSWEVSRWNLLHLRDWF